MRRLTRALLLLVLATFANSVYAHEPNLSSMMMYEQNGKTILLIKSSLTAFEGEVTYNFGKDAYKTPEEFMALVIKHFEKNCLVSVNEEIAQFSNMRVMLGHETTLFAELDFLSQNPKSIFVRNGFFKDMPNNLCELIYTPAGLPQAQYIFNNGNKQQVTLKLEGKSWVAEESAQPTSKRLGLFGAIATVLAVCAVGFLVSNKRKMLQLA